MKELLSNHIEQHNMDYLTPQNKEWNIKEACCTWSRPNELKSTLNLLDFDDTMMHNEVSSLFNAARCCIELF